MKNCSGNCRSATELYAVDRREKGSLIANGVAATTTTGMLLLTSVTVTGQTSMTALTEIRRGLSSDLDQNRTFHILADSYFGRFQVFNISLMNNL